MFDSKTAALTLWRFHCVYDKPALSDAIIGLGSYDLRVASRCAELFRQGFAKKIIFSGASGNWTRDLYPASEAEAFRDHAVAEGVPNDAIILEPHATNIGENMQFCAELLPAAKQILFVTKPQTQLRCKATAKKQWSNAHALVTAPEFEFDDQPLPHHDARALICEMVGDLERMHVYAQRGFQTGVHVPADVQAAFEVLVAEGFVDHLGKSSN